MCLASSLFAKVSRPNVIAGDASQVGWCPRPLRWQQTLHPRPIRPQQLRRRVQVIYLQSPSGSRSIDPCGRPACVVSRSSCEALLPSSITARRFRARPRRWANSRSRFLAYHAFCCSLYFSGFAFRHCFTRSASFAFFSGEGGFLARHCRIFSAFFVLRRASFSSVLLLMSSCSPHPRCGDPIYPTRLCSPQYHSSPNRFSNLNEPHDLQPGCMQWCSTMAAGALSTSCG
ncbi:hypothetical protein SAMN04515648_2578 [Phyllobacterium sp. CL33Tsu]|nr:hypothetical protein SAMN04515648_2578 [Phyllobacterium sp. CL33Tsu]